jgi:serine/threonine protein kinase
MKLGKYEILRMLGQGAAGTVYLGVEPENAQRALKLLARELHSNPSIYARFQSEIAVLQNLNHPNIIKIFEVGEDFGQHFYVMEYLSGGSLAERIKKQGALPIDDALQVATSICSALEHAHGAGIIHRDIKPANILFDENDRAVIVDFGIAKLTDVDGVTVTRQVLGTVEYMSPEQASGKDVDLRSDIYSLGIVLYEMLTGRVPFKSDSIPAVLKSHQYAVPEEPDEWNSSVPDWLNALVLDMIAKEPVKRPQTAPDVVRRIEEGRTATLIVRQCPACDAELESGQVVCVQCGTNTVTGERRRTVTARARPGRKSALPVIVALGIVAAGAIWSLSSFRTPQGVPSPGAEWQRQHFSLGEQFYRVGDLENAETEFKRVIELGSDTELASAASQYLKLIESSRSSTQTEQGASNGQ